MYSYKCKNVHKGSVNNVSINIETYLAHFKIGCTGIWTSAFVQGSENHNKCLFFINKSLLPKTHVLFLYLKTNPEKSKKTQKIVIS